MKTQALILAFALGLAAVVPAEVIITRHAEPLSPGSSGLELSADLDPDSALNELLKPRGGDTKLDETASTLILPFFKIDSTDAGGETTFVSFRNESAESRTISLQIFPADSTLFADAEVRSRTLEPRETWVANLRLETSMPPDPDGFIRGWARFISAGPASGDFFQFNPSQDFATGGLLLNANEGPYCQRVKIRFLLGGTFDGGTLITFFHVAPLGTSPTVPPSITGNVYGEDATFANSFELRTDRFSFEVNAEDLVASGVNFGSMDLVFENEFGGGIAFVEYKASNRFSVGLESVCLD